MLHDIPYDINHVIDDAMMRYDDMHGNIEKVVFEYNDKYLTEIKRNEVNYSVQVTMSLRVVPCLKTIMKQENAAAVTSPKSVEFSKYIEVFSIIDYRTHKHAVIDVNVVDRSQSTMKRKDAAEVKYATFQSKMLNCFTG
jgi:hypothetical protein